MRNKLYLIWLLIWSDVWAVIVVKGENRTVAHNMDNEEVNNSAEHLKETISVTV